MSSNIPSTRRDNCVETIHGVPICDPYRWLEDQQSPETREWIDVQNAHTHSLLDNLPQRVAIRARQEELLRVDQYGFPFERGGRYFFSRRRPEDDLTIWYYRDGYDGEDKVLLDPYNLSSDHSVSAHILRVSEDGCLVMYMIRQGGEDEVEVRFMDVETREHLADVLPRAVYMGFALNNDKSGCYYALRNLETGTRIMYHRMGSDPSEDVYLFGDGYTPEKAIGVGNSPDGKYLVIGVHDGWSKSELYIKNLESDGPIIPVVTGIDAKFAANFAGDFLIMQTDWEAPNNRLIAVDLNDPDQSKWRTIVPERQEPIDHFSLAGGKIFVNYLRNVTSCIEMFNLDGEPLGAVELPGIGASSGIVGRWDKSEAFFSFSSFAVPSTIYRYDVDTGSRDIWTKTNVPLNSDDFEVKQVWFESKDGVKVPMFLVHKKGLELDGVRPTLLNGYGGFNVNLLPHFNPVAAAWAEDGGVYAIANLRGGSEFGEDWHKGGMLDKKQNTFNDFIAAAEWLIDNGYTNPSKLAIQGGSNGGLLVGAALTQRPDLFKAVICSWPLLDMVRYHQFLEGPLWVAEYGSSEDPEQFKVLHSYSPYHNVKPGVEYPATLFVTGDADTRVAPLHARKMAALLQSETVSDLPVLLLYDTKAGHSGGKPLTKALDDLSLEIAFLYWQLGIGVTRT